MKRIAAVTLALILVLSSIPLAYGAENIAYARTQIVQVNGSDVTFEAYALKDPTTGYETNYVKLRDVAFALNGTSAQFQVGWDGAVNIVTGTAYTPNGSENNTPYSGDRTYTIFIGETKVNGVASNLEAITLTDDAGGGYTYYKLRDLGSALGFNVDWSAQKGIFIETKAIESNKVDEVVEESPKEDVDLLIKDPLSTRSDKYMIVGETVKFNYTTTQSIDKSLVKWEIRLGDATITKDGVLTINDVGTGAVGVWLYYADEFCDGLFIDVKKVSPLKMWNLTYNKDKNETTFYFNIDNVGNKAMKRVSMAWECYNSAGDILYDSSTRSDRYGLSISKTLKAGDTLHVSTEPFYNYDTVASIAVVNFEIEYSDGSSETINPDYYIDYWVMEYEQKSTNDNSNSNSGNNNTNSSNEDSYSSKMEKYNAYKANIDEQIKQIRRETTPYYGSESDYKREVSALTSSIASLQNDISSLQLAANSGDRKAQANMTKKQSELAEKQEELSELQQRHTAQVQIQALQDMLDNYYKELFGN